MGEVYHCIKTKKKLIQCSVTTQLEWTPAGHKLANQLNTTWSINYNMNYSHHKSWSTRELRLFSVAYSIVFMQDMQTCMPLIGPHSTQQKLFREDWGDGGEGQNRVMETQAQMKKGDPTQSGRVQPRDARHRVGPERRGGQGRHAARGRALWSADALVCPTSPSSLHLHAFDCILLKIFKQNFKNIECQSCRASIGEHFSKGRPMFWSTVWAGTAGKVVVFHGAGE
jgi:hypothetical protein